MNRHNPKLNKQQLTNAIAVRERGIEGLLSKEELSANHTASLVQFGTAVAQLSAGISVDDARIELGLATAARGGAALFAALGAEEPRDIVFHDRKVRRIAPISVDSQASPKTWWDSFHAARSVGDVYSLDRLAEVDVDLIRQSPTTTGEFGYLLIAALSAYHRREAETPELLLAAMKAADPSSVDPGFKEYVKKKAGPEIELWFRLVDSDEDKFATALEKSLQLHRAYFVRHDAPVLGLVATGPLAACCAAIDSGFKIALASDYLPQTILDSDREDLIRASN